MPSGLAARPTENEAFKEDVVRPLVDAACTKGFNPALNLLYFHGSLLGLTEELGIPVLVGLRGETSGLDRVTELLKAQTKSRGLKIFRSWLKVFLPKLIEAVKGATQSEDAELSPESITAVLGAQIAAGGEARSAFTKEVIKRGFEDAVTFSGGIAAAVFEFLNERRASYLTNVLPESVYEQMVHCLYRLGIVEPRLEVSVCPRCHNHYFVIATHPLTPDRCSRCGHGWVTLELFVFRKGFAEIEFGSSLMALFISAYLREKVNEESILVDAEIFPLAVFADSAGDNREIDVYVPRTALGFECKTFEDVFAPLTPNRLGTVTQRVVKQVKSYKSIGIENIIVATNLPSNAAARVHKDLTAKLGPLALPKRILILEGKPERLIEILDKVAVEIAAALNEDAGKSFEARAGPKSRPPKGRGQRPSRTAPPTSRPASHG